MTSAVPHSDRDLRADARALLRRWMALDEGDILSAIDGLGSSAVAAAAEMSGRLGRGVAASQSAEHALRSLESFASSLGAPPRRAGLFGRDRQEVTAASIEALVETLDRERDEVARSLIGIDSDRKKLAGVAAALDAALALLRACAAAVDAAGREIAIDRPDRGRFLRGDAAARLLAREQDLLTQAAVTQQGVLTLDLIIEGQRDLAQALGRARDTSVAALRTAIAARQAVLRTATLARQTAELERAVDAASQAPASRDDLQRVVDDAIGQARKAIATAEAGGRTRL